MTSFRHLKLEIVLAIPALNDEKYNVCSAINCLNSTTFKMFVYREPGLRRCLNIKTTLGQRIVFVGMKQKSDKTCGNKGKPT